MKCPECNNIVPDGSMFCNHCGHKFEQENTIKCPNSECGHLIPADSKFCPDCGKQIIIKDNDYNISNSYIANHKQKKYKRDNTIDEVPITPRIIEPKDIRIGNITIRMIYVSGGEFLMGGKIRGNSPLHKVKVDDFMCCETPVTQALWYYVMRSNPSYNSGANKPVEQVSWDDCNQFITKLNKLTNMCFRFLTEAEWEYAAKGGVYSKGYRFSGSNDLDAVSWFSDNSNGMSHDVKCKKPNELGLYDMSGNVWEWCYDRLGEYPNYLQKNPKGPSCGNNRICRGGDFKDKTEYCDVTFRFNAVQSSTSYRVGLRLACSI